jgi:hypothetical protein
MFFPSGRSLKAYNWILKKSKNRFPSRSFRKKMETSAVKTRLSPTATGIPGKHAYSTSPCIFPRTRRHQDPHLGYKRHNMSDRNTNILRSIRSTYTRIVVALIVRVLLGSLSNTTEPWTSIKVPARKLRRFQFLYNIL